jgi:hypothetical protein
LKQEPVLSAAARPLVDPLEPRRFFSAPPVPAVQGGILKIWGTPTDDTGEFYLDYNGNYTFDSGTDEAFVFNTGTGYPTTDFVPISA